MDFDTLITGADPARRLPLDSAASAEAGRLFRQIIDQGHAQATTRLRPRLHHRRRVTIGVAFALLTATVTTVTVFMSGNTASTSPAAVRLLDKIAVAASKQPAPAIRDNQFLYIRSWGASATCGVDKCVMDRPHESQIWQSVSDTCSSMDRENNRVSVMTDKSSGPGCPWRGDVNGPTYLFLQSLPTDPPALLNLIYQQMQGQQPRDEEAFTTIGDLLNEGIAPPQVSAALYRAAALIPGVTFIPDATDATGRHGVGVAMNTEGLREEWIFNKETLQFTGMREFDVSDGSLIGETAFLERAVVDHLGQLPG